MSDDLLAHGFRLGTAPNDEDVSRANWIIDRQSARIEALEAKLAKAMLTLRNAESDLHEISASDLSPCEAIEPIRAALAELKDGAQG